MVGNHNAFANHSLAGNVLPFWFHSHHFRFRFTKMLNGSHENGYWGASNEMHFHCLKPTERMKSRNTYTTDYFLFHSGAKLSASPHFFNNSNACLGFKLQIPWFTGAPSFSSAARVSCKTAQPLSFKLTPRRPFAIKKEPAKKFSTVYHIIKQIKQRKINHYSYVMDKLIDRVIKKHIIL